MQNIQLLCNAKDLSSLASAGLAMPACINDRTEGFDDAAGKSPPLRLSGAEGTFGGATRI